MSYLLLDATNIYDAIRTLGFFAFCGFIVWVCAHD